MKTAKADFKFENDSSASVDLVHACKQLSLMTAEVRWKKSNNRYIFLFQDSICYHGTNFEIDKNWFGCFIQKGEESQIEKSYSNRITNFKQIRK